MSVTFEGPRNLVIRPEVEHDLALLRQSLRLGVKNRRYAARDAMAAYNDAMAQVLQNEQSFMVDDDPTIIRVKCRDCGRPSSMQVADEASPTRRYACPCSPGTPRDGYIDEVTRDGRYRLDAAEVLTSPT